MSTDGADQVAAEQRLLEAVKNLDVFSRIDGDGRVLVTDGLNEYEVIVDLSRLLSKRIGYRQRVIAVGTSSLNRLERGEIAELFPRGVHPGSSHASDSAQEEPSSPCYAPLEWESDSEYLDGDDGLAAQGDDWRYTIHPVLDDEGATIGYRVSGGDFESGTTDFGAALVAGEIGELSIAKAKAVAEADYRTRHLEVEQFLTTLLDGYEDDDGIRTRRTEAGQLSCRVNESGVDEVEVAATLSDWDDYDPGSRTAILSLRTILVSYNNGDRDALLDEIRRLIRLKVQATGP